MNCIIFSSAAPKRDLHHHWRGARRVAALLTACFVGAHICHAQEFLTCRETETSVSSSRTKWIVETTGILHQLAGDDLTAFFGFTPLIDVIEDSQLNAFATASHVISLTTGLLSQITSSSELAFVLAHEAAHLLLRHPLSRAALSGSHALGGTHLAQELEADRLALEITKNGGFSANAGVSLLTRLRDRDSASGVQGGLYPSLTPRIKAIIALSSGD